MELRALMALRAARAESDGYLLLVKRRDGSWVAIRGDVNLADLLQQAVIKPPTKPVDPAVPVEPENPIVVPEPPGGAIDNTLPGGWPVYPPDHVDAGLPVPPVMIDNEPTYPPGHVDAGLPIPPNATLPVWPPAYPSGQPVPPPQASTKPVPPSGSTKPVEPAEPKKRMG